MFYLPYCVIFANKGVGVCCMLIVRYRKGKNGSDDPVHACYLMNAQTKYNSL